jgi:hypothetical protein
LTFGISYTGSINKNLQGIDPFADDNRARNYTRQGSRPHALAINYSYEIPNLSRKWDNAVAKVVFDNWQVTGATSVISGTYDAITYSFTGVPTGARVGTGGISAPGSRVVFICDPNLPRGDRTYERQFNTDCVKPPTDQYLLGTASNAEYLRPGFTNTDASFFKHVLMGGNRRLQLRVELYNAFNTDQWTDVNRNAVFDYLTGRQTNTAFGSLTGVTNSARRIQLGARFTF